jgi:hypothetical protein
MVLYEILPYQPAEADLIICRLFDLAGVSLALANEDPRGCLVRQAFQIIVDAAMAWQAALDLANFRYRNRKDREANLSPKLAKNPYQLPPRPNAVYLFAQRQECA